MTTQEQYYESIFATYKTLTLNKAQVCEILRMSQSSLNRKLAGNDLESIPKFRRLGNTPKSPYVWPIHSVAEFLAEVNA